MLMPARPRPTIHFSGDFSPDQVLTQRVDRPRPTPGEVVAAIESAWAAAAARPGIHLFDGPMVRLESWRVENGRPPDAGRYVVQTVRRYQSDSRQLADKYGPEDIANPLGVNAALESCDGYLLLGRRNANVAYHPNRIHPFAGSAVDADVFGEMRRELTEELSFGPPEIASIRLIGLAEDPAIRQPELVFHVLSTLSRGEIERRLDETEHTEAVAIRARKPDVEIAIRNLELTPIAVAALILWNQR